MKYRDIIRKANAVNTNNKWWCDFLYHFSDVHNMLSDALSPEPATI